MKIQSTKLESIGDQSAERLASMWRGAIPEMEEAIAKAEAACEKSGKNLKFRVAFHTTWEPNGKSVTWKLTFGIRESFESAGEVNDPKQEDLRFTPEKN